MASNEQKRADENVLKWLEEQKKEKQEALGKILKLEELLAAKHKLEIEIEEKKEEQQDALNKVFELHLQLKRKAGIKYRLETEFEELKGNLEVTRHLVDEATVQKQVKEMNEKLEEKVEEMNDLEELTQILLDKELTSNDELQGARKIIIEGLSEILNGRSLIGVKTFGAIDKNLFQNVCKERFPSSEAESKARELCILWQGRLLDPFWNPGKLVATEGGDYVFVINEDDILLKVLMDEWGVEIHDAVLAALKQMNEYSLINGRRIVLELWNFKENRKVTLKEAMADILKRVIEDIEAKEVNEV